jgi:hypothetical protein
MMYSSPQYSVSLLSTSKPRAKLSERQVIEIFQLRASALTSTEVGVDYGVSEKAVRDIWKGRTWSSETWHLDTSRPARPLQIKLAGRPMGSKDRNPRKKRAISNDAYILPAQVVHRQLTEYGAENSCVQMSWQMSLSQQQQARQGWGLQCTQSAHFAATCIKDSGAHYRPSTAWSSSPTNRHASVDKQLDEWDSFWRGAPSADPFCVDWKQCSTCSSSAGVDLAP